MIKFTLVLCYPLIIFAATNSQKQVASRSGSLYRISGESHITPSKTDIPLAKRQKTQQDANALRSSSGVNYEYKADSLLDIANLLVETDYTIPSWTLLRRAIVNTSALKDSASTIALQTALNNLKYKEMPYNINTTINKDPKSNLGFAWFTNIGVIGGKVEIIEGNAADSEAFDNPAFTFAAKCDSVININYSNWRNNLSSLAGIPDNTKKCYISNKAQANGLTPNTTYSYRVGKPGAWSETGTFKTAKDNKDHFSFIYITDPQANDDEMFNVAQTNAHTAQNMYPDASFWVNCGDLVESTGGDNSEWEYEQFFETQQDIFLNKPLAPIGGNHDDSPNRNFTHHFNTDSIGFDYERAPVPGSVYSFVYGDALFLALNLEVYYSRTYTRNLSNWMRNQINANPDIKWRIAMIHRPVYTGGSHQPEPDLTMIRNAMAPIFDELKIDLVLQGHDHVYEVIGPVKGNKLVPNAVTNQQSVGVDRWTNLTGKSGGIFNVKDGTLYFLNGHGGTKEYGPFTREEMESVETELGVPDYFGMFTGRFGQTYNPSFSRVCVSSDTICIKTFTVSGPNIAIPYDSIKIIKFSKIANTADSLLNVANSLIEGDYIVPSWTSLKIAIKTASLLKDSVSTQALQTAINNLKNKEMPYSINTTLHKNPQTGLGFAWFTNEGVDGGWVEIVEGTATNYDVFSEPAFVFEAKCDSVLNLNYNVSENGLADLAGIADNTKKSYASNKALATGLTPNTTYSYRVGKPGAWSNIGTFTTAKNTTEKFSFIYTTDYHGNTDEIFDVCQKTAHTADNMFPHANFWLNCGNLADTSGPSNSEWEYEQIFETQQDIFLRKPWVPVVGNHDISENRNFTHHFNTQGNGFDSAMSEVPGSIYSFVYGDALFMALNFESYSRTYYDSIANWMRKQVAATPNTKWRIVFFHKAIYTGAHHQTDPDAMDVRNVMAPVFDELKIDLALQGHDRVYEVIGPVYDKQLVANSVSNQIPVTYDEHTNLTAKAGGTFNVKNGTIYFLNGRTGTKEYMPNSEAKMMAHEPQQGITDYFGLFSGRFGQTGNPTFSHITVDPDTINIKTYTVSDLNVSQLYDNIKIVKFANVATGNKNRANTVDNLSVYPLSVKDFIYIRMKNPVESRVCIYTSNGSLISTKQIKNSTAIDLLHLPKSLYILRVTNQNETYSVKFIKQ